MAFFPVAVDAVDHPVLYHVQLGHHQALVTPVKTRIRIYLLLPHQQPELLSIRTNKTSFCSPSKYLLRSRCVLNFFVRLRKRKITTWLLVCSLIVTINEIFINETRGK